MELQDYINTVKIKLATSHIIIKISIVEERILFNLGYFRARLTLVNNNLLEIAESFTIINWHFVTLGYRYQWMDEEKKKLRNPWDNMQHFLDLPNFPDHVHIIEESNVEASESRNILELIELMEQELI